MSDSVLFSSSINVNMKKEYLKAKYSSLSPFFSEDIVFELLTFDQFGYLLNQEGDYLILMIESDEDESLIYAIQQQAIQKGISTVYLFDCRLDGIDNDSSIVRNLNEQPDYQGSLKKSPCKGAEYNFLYGELQNRCLTNLGDYFTDQLVWLDKNYQPHLSPQMSLPCFFHYNKEHVDEQGNKKPVVALGSVEEVFASVDTISKYDYQDYMKDAFKQNNRGHSPKTEDSFKQDEQINIMPVNFAELDWLLQQNGNFLILIAGPWCANSQAGVATINDYALVNDAIVYMFDFRLDNKYSFDFWQYPRDREVKLSDQNGYFLKQYVDLLEKRLTNIKTIFTKTGWTSSIIDYVDEDNQVHQVGRVQAPDLMAVQPNRVNKSGRSAPILAYCERMYELINTSDSYIYDKANYRDYCAGVYQVFSQYCRYQNCELHDIDIDRTSQIVDGEVGDHFEPAAVEKNLDYNKLEEDYAEHLK